MLLLPTVIITSNEKDKVSYILIKRVRNDTDLLLFITPSQYHSEYIKSMTRFVSEKNISVYFVIINNSNLHKILEILLKERTYY